MFFGAVAFSVITTDEYGSQLLLLENLPTADPHVVGALWANSHVLTISNG